MTNSKEEESDLSLALQFAAISSEDPMERFIRDLSPPLKAYAEETLVLVSTLQKQTHTALIGTPTEAAHAAVWVKDNVGEVAYRWSSLRQALARWSTVHMDRFIVKVGR